MDGRRAGFGIPHVSPYLGGFGSFPMPLQQWTIGRTEKGETKLDKFVIHGGHRLTGEIEVSGAKNAAVALILRCCSVMNPVSWKMFRISVTFPSACAL